MNGKVFLRTWQQARPTPYRRTRSNAPRRRLHILQCLAAHILIDRLYRIVACHELFWSVLLSASAVFFNPPHHGRPMDLGVVTLLDQNSQLSRIHLGILLLLLQSKLEHLALELYRTLAA